MSDDEEEHSNKNAKSHLRDTSKPDTDIEAELRAEIEKEDNEIEKLRAKAEERRIRQEAEAIKQAEEKIKIENEKRIREEEEKRRKEEVAAKKKQLELEKLQKETKKLEEEMATTQVAGEAGGSKLGNILKAKEDMQKSPEQLETEKRQIVASRLVSLNLDRKTKEDMVKIAEEYQNLLINLHSQIYDLNERYDRQRYAMMELAERARQIEKGKAKTRKSNIVHTGLGGSVFNSLNDVFPSAPPKISLFSRYERVTDRRTFKDRRDCFFPKEKKDFVPHRPKAKIVSKLDESKLKPKAKKTRGLPPLEEKEHKPKHHEEAPPPAEEEHHEEEAPAEEEHHEEAEEHHEEEAPAEEEPPAEEE